MTRAGVAEASHARGSGTRARRMGQVSRFLFAAIAIFTFSNGRTIAQEATAAAGLEGKWEGVLGRLHLIVTISRTSGGDLRGQLNSVDQNAMLPIEKASQDGSQVRFEVSRVGGVYQGTMTEDGSRSSRFRSNARPRQKLLRRARQRFQSTRRNRRHCRWT
jgi:hypothetical protein